MQALIAQKGQEITIETLEMFGGKNKETGFLKAIIPYNYIKIKKEEITETMVPFIGMDIGITQISKEDGTVLYSNPNLKFLRKKPEEFDYCSLDQRKELFDYMNLNLRQQKFGVNAIQTPAF